METVSSSKEKTLTLVSKRFDVTKSYGTIDSYLVGFFTPNNTRPGV